MNELVQEVADANADERRFNIKRDADGNVVEIEEVKEGESEASES